MVQADVRRSIEAGKSVQMLLLGEFTGQAAVTAKDVELLRRHKLRRRQTVAVACAFTRRCLEDGKQAGLNRQEVCMSMRTCAAVAL